MAATASSRTSGAKRAPVRSHPRRSARLSEWRMRRIYARARVRRARRCERVVKALRPTTSVGCGLPPARLRPGRHFLVRHGERITRARLAERAPRLEAREWLTHRRDLVARAARPSLPLDERQDRTEVVAKLQEVGRAAGDRKPRVRVAEDVDRVAPMSVHHLLQYAHPVPHRRTGCAV